MFRHETIASFARVVCVTAVCMLLILPATATATATANANATLSWSAPVEVDHGGSTYLEAVACPSSAQCTAVDGFGQEVTFGPGSTSEPTQADLDPNGSLDAVSCPSETQCTGVDTSGHEVTFNPASPVYETPTSIDTGSELRAISCPSATECTAVDGSGDEVTFDPESPGTPTPRPIDAGNYLYSVSCPSESQCTAVDEAGQEVTFNPESPGTPTAVSVDGSGELYSVSCPSESQCTAVDGFGQEVTFDPTSPGTPTPTSIDSGNYLNAVSCRSEGRCVAVDGFGQEVTFDPTSPGAPAPVLVDSDSGNDLNAVACPSESQCSAVDERGHEVTFNPGSPGSPTPALIDRGNILYGASCPSETQCTAVDEVGDEVTFNPTSPGTPTPTYVDHDYLVGVSCPSETQCTAVDGEGKEVTFNPRAPGNPAPATIDPVEYPGDALYGVACPTTAQCTTIDGEGRAITFNPTSPESPTSITVDNSDSLDGISCPSETQCTAVDGFGQEVTFNPRSAAGPSPVLIDTSGYLYSVSCPSETRCTAVDGFGQEVTFNPTEPGTPTPSSVDGGGYPGSVACPSESQCTAVDETGEAATFDPVDPGAATAVTIDAGRALWSVACPSITRCVAFDDRGHAIVAGSSTTEVSASTTAAGAKDVLDEVSLTTTSTLSASAGFVQLTAPAGTVFSPQASSYELIDGSSADTASKATVGPEGAGSNVVDVYLPADLSAAAGSTLRIDAYAVSNPPSAQPSGEFSVSSSAEPTPVKKPFAITPATSVSDLSASANASSAGAKDVVEEASFEASGSITRGNTESGCGGYCEGTAGFVQLAAPAGTTFSARATAYTLRDGPTSLLPSSAVVDPQGAGANVVRLYLPHELPISAGDSLHIQAYEVTNPSSAQPSGQLSVTSSSDVVPTDAPLAITDATSVGDVLSGLLGEAYAEQFVASSSVSDGNPVCNYCSGSGFVRFTAPAGVKLPTAPADYQFADLGGARAHYLASSVQASANTADIFAGRAIERGQRIELTISDIASPQAGETRLSTSSDVHEASAQTTALAPLGGTVTYQGNPVDEAAVQACPTGGGACVASTTTDEAGEFVIGVAPAAGTSYTLTATPPRFGGVAAADGTAPAVVIPGPQGVSGVTIALGEPPSIARGAMIVSTGHGAEGHGTSGPVTFWGEPYEIELEPRLFPKGGTVVVKQVEIQGTNGLTDEPMRTVVDVGGSVAGTPTGVVLGASPIAVTIPALEPMHGEVSTSVSFSFFPKGGTAPPAGITSTQILNEVYQPTAVGGEVPTDPEPAYFVNVGSPQGVTIGPGKIEGSEAQYFEIVPLASIGVPAGTRECGPSGTELPEQYLGATASPPQGAECGVAVKFTPPKPDDKAYFQATLEVSTHSASGTGTIPVALRGCDAKALEVASGGSCYIAVNGTEPIKKKSKTEIEEEYVLQQLENPALSRQQIEKLEERLEELWRKRQEEEEQVTILPLPWDGVFIVGDQYVDPSGTVYAKTEHGPVPLAGATVTLEQGFEPGGPLYAVPNGSLVMSPANRVNPDETDGDGTFGWDVLGGSYAVRASKQGCSTETSSVFSVPPPVTGLSLTLTCATPPLLGATETSLSSSTDVSGYGQPVTLTATVGEGADPGGTVTFDEGATPIGVGVVQNRTATLTVATLTPGEHTITASYSGDGGNQPSTSSPLTQTVFSSAPSKPTLIQQPGSVTVAAGQPASFTATASGTPDPSVQWEVSSNGGATFEALPGATSDTFTISSASTAQSGDSYEAVFSNSQGVATSEAATLTVSSPPNGGGLSSNLGPATIPSATPKPQTEVRALIEHRPLADVLGLPSASQCVRNGSVTVHVHAPAGQKLLSVKLTLGKKVLRSIKFVKGNDNKIPSTVVDLKGLPRGTYTLKIVVKTKSGKTYSATRTYHTCVAGKKRAAKH
jgi:hypothetical protein